jgi:hypothetical protein
VCYLPQVGDSRQHIAQRAHVPSRCTSLRPCYRLCLFAALSNKCKYTKVQGLRYKLCWAEITWHMHCCRLTLSNTACVSLISPTVYCITLAGIDVQHTPYKSAQWLHSTLYKCGAASRFRVFVLLLNTCF